jgi:hypothetical protein
VTAGDTAAEQIKEITGGGANVAVDAFGGIEDDPSGALVAP